MSQPPRPRWFAPSSIPPILLLTFVTSFAFNHALITTQRKQQSRTHRIRISLLEDTIDYNSRLLYHLNPPSSSSSWWIRHPPPAPSPEEEAWIQDDLHSLLRRWKALGLDPVAHGLLPRSNSTLDEAKEQVRPVGPREISWSEIFLGNKESRSTLTDKWHKVTSGIRQSFTQLNPTTPPQRPQEDDKELQELQQMWSEFSQKMS